ncbi:MAG: nucleoside triphosphate pyrophosphatase [Hyphomonadaceae bacterium]
MLASASPRRLDLLKQIGVTPERVQPADVDERTRKGELPRPHALRLAEEKARAISADGAIVLAADTVVACGRRILPKTEAEGEARDCLTLLSGRAHMVLTAVAVRRDERLWTRLSETRVTFKRLSEREIEDYVAGGEWRGKAGGYAVQGMAARFVRALSGSYSGVVGLPLYETAHLLDAAGYRAAP